MGIDAVNHFSKGTRKKDVEEFLQILGYERLERGEIERNLNSTPYYYFKEDDYKHVTGIIAWVYINDEEELVTHTRTSIWRSKFDADFHNFTIKQLWKRFGGWFESDWGKRRYVKYDGPIREKSEGGCYLAFSRFERNLTKAKIYVQYRDFSNLKFPEPGIFPELDDANPMIISNNMAVPFFVSIIEDYFKWTYLALLQYSPKKASVLKNARFSDDDLEAISSKLISIEEAAVRWMSFQNLQKISKYFKHLDKNLDIFGILKKPYRRQKETLYEGLEQIIEHRHLLIHHGTILPTYLPKDVQKDLDIIEAAVKRVYDALITQYGWDKTYL